jgi:hypothetical protein
MKKQKAVCQVESCEKVVYRLTGYCRPHARAFELYGDPLVKKQQQWHGLSVRERFFKYVVRSEGCWAWRSSRDPNGYGRMNIKNYPELAHRVSWLVHYGAIPHGKHVLHKCDNPSCVNPEHLYVGDHQDNMRDKMLSGRHRYVHHQGSAHGMAKLTEDEVRTIRTSPEQGTVLAKRYGVTRTTIYDIRSRKIWRHIP